MFWGRRRTGPPTPPPEPDRDRQAASIAALEQGGLPAAATNRLARQASGALPWTSTLTVSDFLLCRAMRVEPVGQVMGSAVMHIAFNPQWIYGAWQNGDIAPLSRAYDEARERALERLRQEAQALEAHGVVSVQLTATRPAWGASVVEFQAQGTAVRLPGQPLPEQPFLGALSAQDTEKLWRIGYLPMNLVYATTAYYVLTDWNTAWQEQSWHNQEVTGFSEAVYDARSLVVARMRAAARDVGADGVLGTEWEFSVEEIEVDRPLYGTPTVGFGDIPEGHATDHIIYVTVVGTAIGQVTAAMPRPDVIPAVTAKDPSPPPVSAPSAASSEVNL